MKREIKLKAWDNTIGAMGNPMTLQEIGKYAIQQRGSVATHGLKTRVPTGTPIKDLIWLQYTGLKDKNGVEIYQDDIVKYSHDWDGWDGKESSREFKKGKVAARAIYTAKVDWEGVTLAHYIFTPGRMSARTDCNLVEVIGNIHENPELLEKV